MLSISATVSFAASSGRQRMTRSTSSIRARLAGASLRLSSVMLFTPHSPCALVCGNALHRDVALLAKPLLDAEAGRSGGAIDKDGGLRGAAGGERPAFRLFVVGKGHGAFLRSAVTPTGVGDL